MPKRILPLPALLAVLAALGCDPQLFWTVPPCELAGCIGGVGVDVGPLAEEGFDAVIDYEIVSGSFTCDSASIADGGIPSAPRDLTGGLAEADSPVGVECTSSGFFVFLPREPEEPPASLVVDVTGLDSGTTVNRRFDDIAYDIHQPNGPSCEPTCFSSSLSTTD